MSKDETQEYQTALLAHLVMSLAQSTMLALGKIVNPATQKTEVNLEAAQQTIDLLDMLEAKTKGNLDAEEDRMLKSTVSMLKLNFVETAQAGGAPDSPAAESPAPPAEEPSVSAKQDDEKVKFRKTYG